MTQIIGIAGSLRRDSFNAALLQAAREFVGPDDRLDIEYLHDIPMYNYDVEVVGIPASVARLKEVIAGADGLLIATAEFCHWFLRICRNGRTLLSRIKTPAANPPDGQNNQQVEPAGSHPSVSVAVPTPAVLPRQSAHAQSRP